MAKKAKKVETAVVVKKSGNQVEDDILAVVVARAEDTFTQQMKDCQDRIKALLEERDVLMAKRQEIGRKLVFGPIEDKLKAIEQAVQAIRPTMQRINKGSSACSIQGWPELSTVTTAISRDGSVTLGCCFVMEDAVRNGAYNDLIRMEFTAAASDEFNSLGKRIKEIETETYKIDKECQAIRLKAMHIPKLERQYRAKIAQRRLESNDEGLDALKAITGDLDQSIAALTVLG